MFCRAEPKELQTGDDYYSLEPISMRRFVRKTRPPICTHSETMLPTTCPHLPSGFALKDPFRQLRTRRRAGLAPEERVAGLARAEALALPQLKSRRFSAYLRVQL